MPTGTITALFSAFAKEQVDPSLESISGRFYQMPMYDWFIGARDGKLNTALGVMKEFTPNAGATAWTARLKEGVKFHDGAEATSEDTKFSLEWYMRPASVCSSCGTLTRLIAGVDVLDKYTVTIRLKQPSVIFNQFFGPLEGDVVLLPKHYIDKVGADGFSRAPIGTGPWKFSSRKLGSSITYEANSDYWDPTGVPGFAKMVMQLVPEASTRIAMLRRGEADLIPIRPEDAKPLQQSGFRLVGPRDVNAVVLQFFRSNAVEFLSHDVRFRKALTLAVDWSAIYDSFYVPEVATRYAGGAALLGAATNAADPALPPYGYDVNKAKALLADMGYAGQKVTFWTFAQAGNPEQLAVNEVIASYWRKAGIDVALSPIDYGTFRPKMVPPAGKPQDFSPPAEVAVLTYATRPSALSSIGASMITREAGGTTATYWSPAIDGVYKTLTAMVDESERTKTLQQLNRQLYEEYWAIPIVSRHGAYAAGPAIASWQPTNMSEQDMRLNTLKPSH